MPEWIEVTREEQIVVLQTRVGIPNGTATERHPSDAGRAPALFLCEVRDL